MTKWEKAEHKKQLIENIVDFMTNGDLNHRRTIRRNISQLTYRKIKKMSKILCIYERYYDDSPSDAEFMIGVE